jgi:7-cyano-7-deazaguanine synthase in queuosine biosynthesis
VYELRPLASGSRVPNAKQLTWGSPGEPLAQIVASIDPWLQQLGGPSGYATDLVRVATAAYIADRLTRRPRHFVRSLALHVQVSNAEAWAPLLQPVVDLLYWLTGDTWALDVSTEDPIDRRPAVETDVVETIALLSGGLDSFCGAVLAGPRSRRLVSHADNNTIVKGAQNRAYAWLADHIPGVPLLRVTVTQREAKQESSSRSRSLLFLALGVAVADASRASIVEVPENGFTSLNLPLSADRGGALSTRSTHPTTLHRFNQLLSELGIRTRVVDPYAALTKGEFLAQAAARADHSFAHGAAETLSCGKLDGARYTGGNANYHCGLCMPCIVRRGAFIRAAIPDETMYLSELLGGDARQRLLSNRSGDVTAIKWAVGHGVDDVSILGAGPYPPGFDLDVAHDLCERGLAELVHRG